MKKWSEWSEESKGLFVSITISIMIAVALLSLYSWNLNQVKKSKDMLRYPQNYIGKIVTVYGEVGEIKETDDGNVKITLVSSSGITYVCTVSKDEAVKLLARDDAAITCTGTFAGTTIEDYDHAYANLVNCILSDS